MKKAKNNAALQIAQNWAEGEFNSAPSKKGGMESAPIEQIQRSLEDEIANEFGLTQKEKDFIKSKKSLGGVVSSLSQKGLINHVTDKNPLNDTGDGRTSDTVAITDAGMKALNAWENKSDDAMANRRETARIEKREEAEESHEDAPNVHELEERLNDLESTPKKGVGRGFANAGKKYNKSGVRVEEFKLGKAKVKKGDKLFFKIGKEEVCGVFSHLNQCVHCPEGYAVIRFEGKNYERRQTRVSVNATAE